jgi:isopentenyl diphosphate isomerase/L-lactate dehydrogenase-like FMN-dependent dehydrogenase
MDRALSWETIARIRERWHRKLVIKGLLSVEDIARAVEIGADAVAISNHGGRQLDWAVAPLGLLGVPSIAELNPRLLVHSDQVWGGRRSVT